MTDPAPQPAEQQPQTEAQAPTQETEAQAPPPKAAPDAKKKSFWTTLPGILAGIAAVFTAIGGLLTALITAGVISPRPTATPLPAATFTPVMELRVVETLPRDGANDVDPTLAEVVIVFGQPVRTDSWSFIELEGSPFPDLAGDPTFRDERTCVLPVKLAPGAAYGIGINGPQHKGFVSATDDQVAVEPYALRFSTAP